MELWAKLGEFSRAVLAVRGRSSVMLWARDQCRARIQSTSYNTKAQRQYRNDGNSSNQVPGASPGKIFNRLFLKLVSYEHSDGGFFGCLLLMNWGWNKPSHSFDLIVFDRNICDIREAALSHYVAGKKWLLPAKSRLLSSMYRTKIPMIHHWDLAW